VALLKPVFPEADRKIANDHKRENGADLVNTGNFAIQVKRYKKPAPITKLYEASGAGGMPVLLTRGDGGEWLVAMRAEDWLRVLADIGEAYW